MFKTSPDIFEVNGSGDVSIVTFLTDSFKDFINWWYVKSPVISILRLKRLLTVIDDKFSISFSLKTFFIPWHRDYSFVGYVIGIIMRILILIPGLIVYISTLAIFLLYLVFWILIPIISVSLTIISPIL